MRAALALALLAALAPALQAAGQAAGGDLGHRYCLGMRYVNETAVVRDVARVDYLMVINNIRKSDGRPLDTPRGHNDDSLTTGRFIAVLVEAYQATGWEGYLDLARVIASVFDPARVDGPVYSDNDDPRIYLEYDKPGFQPEQGMVFWGSNGTHWFHPSDEQAVGAVYGLFKLWNATGEPRYAEWIKFIVDGNLGRSSSLLRAIMAEAAYQATGDPDYRRIADDAVTLYLDSIRAKYRPGRVWCVTSFGTVYMAMALDFPHLRGKLLGAAERYMASPIIRALYNESTGAVYFKRALYPDGSTSFYDPACSAPDEAPGGPRDPTGVQVVLYNFNLVTLLSKLYQLTGNRTYLNVAGRVLQHYASLMVTQPGAGYSPAVVGSFPPFAFDRPLPPTNAYVAAARQTVSTQATVAFLEAVHAYARARGLEPPGPCAPQPASQEPGGTPAPQPAWGPSRLYAAAVIAASLAVAVASTVAQARRGWR